MIKKIIVAAILSLIWGTAEARTASLAPNMSGSLSPSTAKQADTMTVTPTGSSKSSPLSSIVWPVSNGGAGALKYINAIGDSISNSSMGTYSPPMQPFNAPAWAANTEYLTGQYVYNNSMLYRYTATGTSASSIGPTGTSTGTDGTATYIYTSPQNNKSNKGYLSWVELFTNGLISWDQSQGYSGVRGGVIKGIVINGGSGYTNPTLTLTNGATGTLQTANGKITGVTITNPGYPQGAVNYSISDGTGSGAILHFPNSASGTFATSGNWTQECRAMVQDAAASKSDIIVVLCGTNDISNNVDYSIITENLRSIYEGIMNSGKMVVAVPILPRANLTASKTGNMMRVNRWIRAYTNGELWANPSGYKNIVLADPTGYMTDGTSATLSPIGGTGGTSGSMTTDGLHPTPRGAMYIALAIVDSIKSRIPNIPLYTSRSYSFVDGYDGTYNPSGNLLEGLPWTASTEYGNSGLNVLTTNDTPKKVYRLTVAGTSASSGGPTGTGSNIVDGTAKWTYVGLAGKSVFASGTGGTNTAATGITYSGDLAAGYTMSRPSGTAMGTITESIETPWSNGQIGQRQVISFSLGSGAATEYYQLLVFNTPIAGLGIINGDKGTKSLIGECEVELSNVANMNKVTLQFQETNQYGVARTLEGEDLAGSTIMASSGEVTAIPNSGKLFLRTTPLLIHSAATQYNMALHFGFNASGGAGSATATVKINYCGVRKID